MSKIKLVDLEGKISSEVELNKNLLVKPHNQAMFDCVIAENAAERQGTHSTLTKGEVRGGGKKPLPQKHTGNARQGSIRNPHYVGGGIVFGPKPNRNYKNKVNSKISSLAIKSALSVKLDGDAIYGLIDEIKLTKPSTKKVLKMINNLKLNNKKILFITNDDQEKLISSVNNIAKACAKKWNTVSTKDILNAQIVILQKNAMEKMAEARK